jgi:hypothetical protein
MGKAFKRSVAICIGLALAAAGYLSYRNNVMDRLYAEAGMDPRFFQGSQEAADAVRRLATYRGQRSTEYLLALAVQTNVLAPDVQTEAIRALRERNDPTIAPALAALLQPHEGLKVRQSAATALQGLPCKGECIVSILHYLERMWRGDLNYEDRWVDSAGADHRNVDLKAEQESVYAALYAVLRRERMETLGGLIKLHGIGTTNPSAFALDLLARLQIQEACPYLLQSDRQLKDLSPEFYKAPRQELQSAIASLKCHRKPGDSSEMPYTPGRPTCNLFVQRDIAESGAPKPVVTKADGTKAAPGAAEWAKSPVPGWRFLKPGEKPKPGDVAAYALPGHTDYTGHSGIVVSVSKRSVVTAVAAHPTKIGIDMSFQPGVATYRRYTGE